MAICGDSSGLTVTTGGTHQRPLGSLWRDRQNTVNYRAWKSFLVSRHVDVFYVPHEDGGRSTTLLPSTVEARQWSLQSSVTDQKPMTLEKE